MNEPRVLAKVPFVLRAVAVAVLLTIALGYMIGERVKILTDGAEIVLKTEPLDPRDLFRGHYARLNYDVSRIKKTALATGEKFSRNDPVFVALAAGDDGYWRVVTASKKYPAPEAGQVVMQGTVRWAYSKDLRVRYGIEKYFAPKAEALKLEKLTRDRVPVGVIVRISKSGRAAISGLMINGRKVYDEPLF